MRKLVMAAVVAGSMFAMADEAAKPAEKAETAAQEEAKPMEPTPEQIAKFRERRAKMMAARQAELESRVLPIIKKYGLDDEKAKNLLKEVIDAIKQQPQRRARPAAMKRMPKAPEAKAE